MQAGRHDHVGYNRLQSMIKLKYLITFYIPIFVFISSCNKDNSHGIAFEGGLVFNGQSFESKTFYVVNSLITFNQPSILDSTIQLNNQYVIPPYGEAHNHNIDDYNTEEKIRSYLSKGIFYVKVPNILPRSRQNTEPKINRPNSIDAIFSNGGLTGSGGHPIGLVDFNIKRGVFQKEDAEGQFYHTVNDTSELRKKWPLILSGNPDFIKIYLLHSEEYEKRKNDTTFYAWKGLSPEVSKYVVATAHEADLKVSAHIETAADFKNAVLAGVDEINHFPGFRPQPQYFDSLSIYKLDELSVKAAGEQNITVVTTLAFLIEEISEMDVPDKTKMNDVLRHNISLLKKYNVPIAIGSDNYGGTSYDEAKSLAQSGLFSNSEILNMWTVNTVVTIFPNEKLGYLKEGYFANFLVLTDNPLEDFNNFQKISMMVKAGHILENMPNNGYNPSRKTSLRLLTGRVAL